ncbi:MAG: methyltransferase domain-containing protein [Candidatus Cloacimonetes bacterium]|nr:methyltransferase domain-containing protein [Candidatus Cloacimonadota bacterium]
MDLFHLNLEDLQKVTNCTNCNSSKTFCIKLNQIAVDSLRYSLYECLDCGFWFSPKKDGEAINYESYDETLSLRDESYIAERYIQKLRNFDFNNFKSIVEIGCAQGHVLSLLKKSYSHLRLGGVELNSNMCSLSRDKGIDCYTDYTSHEQRFDVIMANHVIEHFDHSSQFIELFQSLGQANHYLILNFPNKENVWTKRGFYPDLHLPFHRFYYSIAEISTILENNGYLIKSSTTSEQNRYFENMKQARYNHYRGDIESFKGLAPRFQDVDEKYSTQNLSKVETHIDSLNLGSEAMIIAVKL